MRLRIVLTLACVSLPVCATPASFTINPTGDPNALWGALVTAHTGITISSATYLGHPVAAGTFVSGPLGISDGIILSTGTATAALPPNASTGTSTSHGGPGHPLLSTLTAPSASNDAALLELTFDLAPGFRGVGIEYLFATEEYPEYVGDVFSDAAGAWLNGANIALDEGGNPLNVNGPFFSGGTVITPPANGMEADGSTPVFTSAILLGPGSTGNTLQIGVADASDTVLDSWFLVSNLHGIPVTAVPEPSTMAFIGLGLVVIGLSKRNSWL